MQNIKETVDAIKGLLVLRGFDKDYRFYQEDQEMRRYPAPWVIGDKLNMELVEYAADILGVTTNELLNMEGGTMERWSKKYPLVKYWEGMIRSADESYLVDTSPEKRLLSAIYSAGEGGIYVTRYSLDDLKRRAMKVLAEQEDKTPGTIHPGEAIENFHASTVYICHYPQITEMLDSFFAMVERGSELFLKALRQDLDEEEICEYNLIVSYTGIRDKHFNLHGLYYRYLVKFRPLYQEEERADFFVFVMLSKDIPFKPWKFAEVISDRIRMDRYLSYVPNAKMLMGIFAIEGLRYECSFTWSDAEQLAEEERYAFGQLHTSIWARLDKDYAGKRPTVVYVPKRERELGEDGPYFETMRTLAEFQKEGSLVFPAHSENEKTDVKKMINRVKIILGRKNEVAF